MLADGSQGQIIEGVVCLIAVDVMHVFFGTEGTSEMNCHDCAVFCYVRTTSCSHRLENVLNGVGVAVDQSEDVSSSSDSSVAFWFGRAAQFRSTDGTSSCEAAVLDGLDHTTV